jgi:hypothetical protein
MRSKSFFLTARIGSGEDFKNSLILSCITN